MYYSQKLGENDECLRNQPVRHFFYNRTRRGGRFCRDKRLSRSDLRTKIKLQLHDVVYFGCLVAQGFLADGRDIVVVMIESELPKNIAATQRVFKMVQLPVSVIATAPR